jgi:subtilisin family serine protease
MKLLAAALLLSVVTAKASVVAIIDSGTDYRHEALRANIWRNPLEIKNGVDDDGNNLIDDIYGWNFAEGNAQVIDYKYLDTFSSDPYKFFEIQARGFLGTQTQEDKEWVAIKRQDPEFMKEMQKFGNFVHGTHVAGIAAKDNKDAKILSVKLIPTEASPFIAQVSKTRGDNTKWTIPLLKILLEKLAQQQMEQLKTITTYVGDKKSDVANGSFGTSYNQIFGMIKQLMPNAEDAVLEDLVKHFFKNLIDNGFKMVAAAPNTLFVFAAGNDGDNNDLHPTSPANIKASNVITVAATMGRNKLASFSNYGKVVDVAAPGVIIESSIPGDEYLKVSGTSQAAPYVANVAAKVKDMNPALTAEEIKRIVLSTVDVKDYLLGKVASSGIVNLDRALYAAKLSVTYSLNYSIQQSKLNVLDVPTPKVRSMMSDKNIYVLPLPSTLNF